jgi:hypothetical protein
LAIDFAKPWMESERKDALAASARAIACLRLDGPLYPYSEGCVPHLVPNHADKNRCAPICRESGVNIFLDTIQRFLVTGVADRGDLSDVTDVPGICPFVGGSANGTARLIMSAQCIVSA